MLSSANDTLLQMFYDSLSEEDLKLMLARKVSDKGVKQQVAEVSEEELFRKRVRKELVMTGKLFAPVDK